jgi:hypothetical protein
MNNTLTASGELSRNYGSRNILTSSTNANQSLYGVSSNINPHAATVSAFGELIDSATTTVNDPSAQQIGIYIDWKLAGTDSSNKRWSIYNASSNTTAGKVFLGLDNVKTYWGTNLDVQMYYDNTQFVIDDTVTQLINFQDNALITTGTLGAGQATITKMNLGGGLTEFILNGVSLNAIVGATSAIDTELQYVALQHSNTPAAGARFMLSRSRGTFGSQLKAENNDVLAAIDAAGYDGTDYVLTGQIDFEVDGATGSNDMPGRIVLKTTADGGVLPTTRWTIDSTGTLKSGTDGTGAYDILTAGILASNSHTITGSNNAQLILNAGAANLADGQLIDMMEAGVFGSAGGYGARVKYDGSANQLLLQTSDNGAENTWITIPRASSGTMILDGGIHIRSRDVLMQGTLGSGNEIFYITAATTDAGAGFYLNNDAANPKASANSSFGMLAEPAKTQLAQFVSDGCGNQFVFTNLTNRTANHDHAAQTNPTIFIHSDKSPDTDNTEWLSLTHNQTSAQIESGSGGIVSASSWRIGDTTSPTETAEIATGNLVLPKTSGTGIKVDPAAATFGWRDLLGSITVKPLGATDPTLTNYRNGIYAYAFDRGAAGLQEVWIEFHMPHDYVPGTDVYIHAHWSQNVVDTGGAAGVPGAVIWNFEMTYADGYGTAGGAASAFGATVTETVTQQGSTTQYGHMIGEVQASTSGGSGTKLDTDDLEIDGIILVRVWRNASTAGDTLDQDPFLHFVDIHYQSTNIATKAKAPDFYT